MPPSVDVHRSLPPIRTVTYPTFWLTAVPTWPARSAILAPLTASFVALAVIPRRRAWLFTAPSLPVDHDRAGQSTYGNEQSLKARVIESPVEAMEAGCGVESALTAAGAAMATRTSNAKSAAARDCRTLTIRQASGTGVNGTPAIKGGWKPSP